MKKRVLSLFLAITLCLTLTPTGALAAEGQPPEQTVSVTQEAQIPAPAPEEKEEEKTTPAENGADENASPVNPQENPTENAPAAAEKNTADEETGKEAGQNEPTAQGENEPLTLALDDAGQNAADGENSEAGGTPISEGDTRTEIWCTSKPTLIQRSYDGTTDGSRIPIDLTFTDGTDTFTLEEETGFTAKKTFDSADAGSRTVTVEIELIGDAAAKYKLKAGEETFTIGGYIDKATPELTVSLSKAACTVGEKILPLLSVSGVQENAAVTYYYTQYKTIAGDSDYEGNAIPAIDESTAISSLDEEGNNTYYIYAKTGETKNYKENRSATVELTVSEKVDPVASVTTADGTETPYGSFSDAWAAVTANEGSTLKLLADGTLSGDNTDISKSITLDLNGYVLGSNGSLTVKSGAALTVRNAGAENLEKPVKAGLYLTLLVEKGGSFTCTDGKIRYLGLQAAGTGDYSIKLAEGENHCAFGGFAQGDANATIGDLLKATPGMALYAEDAGSTVQIARSTLISKGFNYFSFYVGACSEHKMDANGTCIYCGASYVASVTTGGETVSYTSLDDALNAAQDGDTVTLLSDVDLGETYVTINKSITFDLGGKTLSSSKTWSSDGVLLIKNATVTVKNGTVNATGIGNCAIRAYGSGASMTLEDVTATVTSDESSVMVGDFGSAVIKSGDYQGLYVGAKSQVTLEGGTFRPYMDTITTNENVKSIFWKVNETTDTTSRDCMELLGDGCVYVDETGTQVRTGGGFNTVVTVQQGTAIDAPVAKIGDVEYASLSKAINAVQNGGTITLLNDLDLGNGAVLQVGSPRKNFTIDLASHTLSADGDCLIMLHNGSQLTLKNGTLDGSRCTSYEGVLYISSNSGPKLTLENVTAKNVQRSVPLVYVTNGTVEFDGGTYTGGVLLKTDGNAVLKSGTFQKGTNDYSIKTEDSGKHLSDYLDDDSQFWDDNTPLDLSNETQTADEVTVRPCEHKWENGKCTVCQKVCDHGSADGKSMTEDPCHTCGMKAAAQVDITGSATKYFPSFNDALVYAYKNDGCTLKLLADVTEAAVMINNPFLFDLNGHNVDTLSVDAKATIKDSGTTKGRIGKVTVSNEKVTDLTLGGLLEEGYAFKYGNGYWANDSYLQTTEGSFVTVEKAPIQSVNVYAKDKNNQEILTIAYGATGEVTLVSSCKLSETSGEKLSCAWYKLTDDTAIPPLEGATGTSYTLPADLPAGKHTYWVTFTSDGYSKSAEITVTVTPVSLAGAEVTVQNPTYNGKEQSPTVTVKLGDKTLSRDNDYTMEVTKQTDAGSYKLTIKGWGNYTDEIKNVEWKIEPMKIDSVMVSSDISKTYDGTAAVTKTAEEWAKVLTFKTLSAYAVVDVPSEAYTISDAYFVEKSGEETIHSPDAGEKYGITFKIALKSSNYVLQNYYDEEPAETKEITQSGGAKFTIRQANVTSPGEITQLVFNDLAKTYTLNLAALLPRLSEGCGYGKIQYHGCNYHFTDNTYLDSNNNISVSKEGILTLPTVSAHTSDVNTQIGTITVPVVTTNYQKFEFTIKVVISARIPLNASGVTVSASEITYGQTLNESKLTATGTMKHPGTGEEVKGTFAWTNPEAKPGAAGDYTASWTFTPAEGYEEYAPATGNVTVKVNKADPTFTAPTAQENLTYTGQEQALITAGMTDYGTMQYSLTEDGTYSQNIPTGTDAGKYTVWYRVIGDANHNNTTPASVTVIIGQKPLPITGVTAASKTYDGTTNADISSVTFDNVTLNRDTDYTVTASFDDAGVGSGKNVTATVTLMGQAAKNYFLEQSSFTATGSITKAAAPDSGLRPAVTVINDLAKTYEMVLSNDYLPKLSSPCEYGNVSYSLRGTYLTDGYKDTVQVKVMEENGQYKLKLTVPAVDYNKVSSVGTIDVRVTSDNYQDFYLTIGVKTKNKDVPVPDGTISASDITYGQALNDSKIAGKMKAGGKAIDGTFTWTNGTFKPAAGDYTASWTFTPAEGYEEYATATGIVTVTVNRKAVTVSGITAKDKVYDGKTNATLDCSNAKFDGVLENDTLTVTATGTFEKADTGEQKVTISGLELSGASAANYVPAAEGSQRETTATITAKEVTVTITPNGGTYGSVTAAAAVLSGVVDGETVPVTLTYTGNGYNSTSVPTDVDSYTVTASIADSNYILTGETTANFVITPKTVIVSGITAKDKAYDGTTNATLDFSNAKFDGILENDNLTVTAKGVFEKTEAGKWNVAISDLTLGGNSVANYVLAESGNQTETTATITAKQITVSITPNGGTYGETITPATVKANDVVGEDTPTITLTYTGTANDGTAYADTTPPAKAGTYTVTATTTNPNYTLDPDTNTAEFAIAKRPATVTPDNKSKVYKEKDPDLTYKVDGVLDGETLTGITLTRAEGENAGKYAITATADANANPNYEVTFAEGKFTINPKSIDGATVKLGKALTANGAEQTQTVEKVLLDGKELPADSYTVAGNTATAPGSHTLTITAKGNYTGTVEQTYVIAPAKAEDAPGEEIAIGSGEVKVVVKSEGAVPPATLLTNKAELLAMLVDNGDITADELAQIADGASVDIALTVKEANVPDEVKTAMAQAAKGCTIGQYLDISLFKYMTVNGSQQAGVALRTTKNALTISVAVPDALINTNSAVNRTYCIVRNHEGTITVLDAAFDAAGKTLTFKTDRFSDYAIAYKDTAVPGSGSNPSSNNSSNDSESKKNEVAAPTPASASTSKPSTITAMPQTGDTSNPTLYVVLLVASLLGLAVVFVCKKRNDK